MKKSKWLAVALGLAVVTTVVAQTIPCVVFVRNNCPSTATINGTKCTLDTGYGTTYYTLESGSGYDAYQTVCPQWACYYNCDGTVVANGGTYTGTINCSGGQVGFCD